jgi:Flp pilus assembly pilin Flp
MLSLKMNISAFIHDESGATMIEYGVIVCLILGAALSLINPGKDKGGKLSQKIKEGFNTVSDQLGI